MKTRFMGVNVIVDSFAIIFWFVELKMFKRGENLSWALSSFVDNLILFMKLSYFVDILLI
jgi:hypothetical protein